MDRTLSLEFARVVEAAALRSGRLLGRGQKDAADGLAVDAMRQAFDSVRISGTVVIGEGHHVPLAGQMAVQVIGEAGHRKNDACNEIPARIVIRRHVLAHGNKDHENRDQNNAGQGQFVGQIHKKILQFIILRQCHTDRKDHCPLQGYHKTRPDTTVPRWRRRHCRPPRGHRLPCGRGRGRFPRRCHHRGHGRSGPLSRPASGP